MNKLLYPHNFLVFALPLPLKISSEATVRDEIPSRDPSHSFARKASSATMALAGPSSKFATKYTWIAVDTRDRKNDPSRGSYLESEIEVSSRPGTSEFVKADIQTQIHGTVGSDIWGQRGLTWSLCGSLGVLYPYRLLLESPTSYGRVKSESQETARPLSPMSPGFICLSDRYCLTAGICCCSQLHLFLCSLLMR